MSEIHKISKHLADNLTQLRVKKAMSQSELAKTAGIPRSTLTNIESGSGNPSLQNLAKISEALQVGIEELLSKPRNECELISARNVPVEKRSQGRVRIARLIPDRVKGLEVDRMEISVGVTMTGHPHLSGAKEYFSVLQGEVIVHVAGEKYLVMEGDVLAFPGDQPHSYRNGATVPAIGISIVIPVALGWD